MPELLRLTWEEWVEEYKPYTDEEGNPRMFDPFSDKDAIAAHPDNLIWTYLEGDTGTLITEGYHYVNRLGYYLTEKSSLPDISYEIDYVADEENEEE
jgi:hypothetical protein